MKKQIIYQGNVRNEVRKIVLMEGKKYEKKFD